MFFNQIGKFGPYLWTYSSIQLSGNGHGLYQKAIKTIGEWLIYDLCNVHKNKYIKTLARYMISYCQNIKTENMKTFYNIQKTSLLTFLMVCFTLITSAQKSYHRVSLENGLQELNQSVNQLVEKFKIKFDLRNTETMKDLPNSEYSQELALTENEGQVIENYIKFDVSASAVVSDESLEVQELNQLTDQLEETLKFDVTETNIHRDWEVEQEIAGLAYFTDFIAEKNRFDASSSLVVTTDQAQSTY